MSGSTTTMELDFLGIGTPALSPSNAMDQLHRDAASISASTKSQFQKFLERERSFRGIQQVPMNLSSEVLKSVIATRKSLSVPSSPMTEHQNQIPYSACLPVYSPVGGGSVVVSPVNDLEKKPKPLTIFYGGSVSVYDVTPDMAESIVKLAMEGLKAARAGAAAARAGAAAASLEPKFAPKEKQQLVNVKDHRNEELPIFRSKSLQRFLEKRKERLKTVSPFGCHTNN